ncbi:hypothetical protein SBA2_120013 [Acidobacteriia bacterium SbA2]|nr:hypothetical protein SBA2_120013 [Acidobacteriia bacterium SbA2]
MLEFYVSEGTAKFDLARKLAHI